MASLLFKDLSDNDTFVLGLDSKVYQKMPLRKRSSQRPFACNAKVSRPASSRTVKQGYFLDDTVVYHWNNGLKIWFGSLNTVPSGWIPVTAYSTVLELLNIHEIRQISFHSSVMDLDEESNSDAYLFGDAVCKQVIEAYKVRNQWGRELRNKIPIIKAHNSCGFEYEGFELELARLIQYKIQEAIKED